jgi:hypothetical protein
MNRERTGGKVGQSKPVVYVLNDEIVFRIDKTEGPNTDIGIGPSEELIFPPDPFAIRDPHGTDTRYSVHFLCSKHQSLEMSHTQQPDMSNGFRYNTCFVCARCDEDSRDHWYWGLSYDQVVETALSLYNSPLLKDARLVRIDDVYTPEARVTMEKQDGTLKTRVGLPEGYKIVLDIKKDKDDDTMLMLQIMRDGMSKGAQFFIKPEKGQLTSDHNNPDPKDFISEIVVRFKDRELRHVFEEEL